MIRHLRMLALPLALWAASCSTAPSPDGGATVTASASRGQAYAERVCAACHAVGAGQQSSPNPNAPPFQAIANTPGMTATALNAWLHSAHASMPNLVVEPNDRADIYAYLEALRRGGGAS